jgi:hypothetical protein
MNIGPISIVIAKKCIRISSHLKKCMEERAAIKRHG